MKRNHKFFRTWKHRGEWAELAFMAEAASRGLNVAKPWGDSSRYDVAVENRGRFTRVQVKSTSCCQGHSYACSVRPNLRGRPYQKGQFDFLAAYIVPEDVWYIIPARLVVHGRMGMVILSPSVPGHKYERYLEAWHLLDGKGTKPARSKMRAPAPRSKWRDAHQTLELAPR